MRVQRVGIIGGGQLGRMMILDAKKLDIAFIILDPNKECPAHSIADEHIVADFTDIAAFIELSKKVDIITYEFEHISVEALKTLEQNNVKVYPSSYVLSQIQNKYIQKKWLEDHNILVPRFMAVNSIEDIKEAGKIFGYPIVLKTCTGGYDGKGNYIINSFEEIEEASQALGSFIKPLMVEEFIKFEKEISILVCKGLHDASIYPISENIHKNSILDETIVPARISNNIKEKAIQVAHEVLKLFNTYGMLCIEMFISVSGNVYVNELAPRPHNSGHYTIEGCYTSQFEQHIRSIVGFPLGSTKLLQPTVMKNIIGKVDDSDNVTYECLNILQEKEVKLHLYGKTHIKKGRKMGHITVCDETIEHALKKVRQAHKNINI